MGEILTVVRLVIHTDHVVHRQGKRQPNTSPICLVATWIHTGPYGLSWIYTRDVTSSKPRHRLQAKSHHSLLNVAVAEQQRQLRAGRSPSDNRTRGGHVEYAPRCHPKLREPGRHVPWTVPVGLWVPK